VDALLNREPIKLARAVVDGSDELLSTILARVFWTRWTLRRLETEVPNKIELV